MKEFLTYLVLVIAVAVVTARVPNSDHQDVDKSPKQLIKVKFPSGAECHVGNELTPTQVKDAPSISYPADKQCYYTLIFLGRVHGDAEPGKEALLTEDKNRILTDPDVCYEKDSIYREYLHWLVVNIPGDNVTEGEVFAQYISSGAPMFSGFHRYTFLVYKQPGKLHFDETKLNNKSILGRDNYCLSAFTKKYRLGDPVAGNYYLAKYDHYVLELYKKFGINYVLGELGKYFKN